MNKNPTVRFDGAPNERYINDQLSISDFITKRHKMLVCHPFRNLDKSEIIKLYKQNNIWDLFELTRSCEGDKNSYPGVFKELDYNNYIYGQDVPICGECFWCKERRWGIDNA